ncbi:MAG: hypothetical protein HFJ80_07920 [Clostridiales bacterium]|nr:hypothetical protein [Clostridiales bacterium]
MGFRDRRRLNYWGRIPKALEEIGCQVYYGNQDGNGTIESNAAFLSERIQEIINETGAAKLNVIAHSKGGLDMRYAISSLEISPYIASLTTISTPHHGSLTVDKLIKLPQPVIRFIASCTDRWLKICGDQSPHTYAVIQAFTTQAAEEFNRRNPDDPSVYYQSYAFVMKHVWSDMLMLIPGAVVYFLEGPNDGLLTPEAAAWTNFRGIISGNSARGISHFDEVDLRRKRITHKQGEGVQDITEFYKEIVRDLCDKGF